MLTFLLGSNSTSSSTDGITLGFEATIEYRFGELCTFFLHDDTQDDFTGFAAIGGAIHVTGALTTISSGLTSSTSSSVAFTGLGFMLTVVDSTFDTANHTGTCALSAGIAAAPPGLGLLSPGDTYTSLDARFVWNPFSLVGGTGVTGQILGSLTLYNSGSDVFLASARPFSLLRDAECSVSAIFSGGTGSTIILP